MKRVRVERASHKAYTIEAQVTPSEKYSHCAVIERLPSWREFSDGMPLINPNRGYFIPASLEGFKDKANSSVSLKYPNPISICQSYISSSLSVLPQQNSSQAHALSPSLFPDNTILLRDVADLTSIQNIPPKCQATPKCDICGRGISRDLTRHIRRHNRGTSFKCFYPKAFCPHKSGCFHRKYDLKKHLLHYHFSLQNSNIKRLKSLTDKLEHEGTCPCGKRMKASEWLIHVFARDLNGNFECDDLRKKTLEEAKANRTHKETN